MTDTQSQRQMRGVDDGRATAQPVARAVIIGLGGAGIQTISRIESMVKGRRPEEAVTSRIAFLGVDAVGLSQQNPPLDPGVGIQKSDLFNVAANQFNPYAVVEREIALDGPLAQWWKPEWEIPNVTLDKGLKQNRAIGRLAYYRSRVQLVETITQSLRKAGTIDADLYEGGQAAMTGQPEYIIVSSMCGGTGSSGLLDMIFNIWEASQGQQLSPQISVYLFAPGIFEAAVRSSSHTPDEEIQNQRSNAYAFLRELDHFIENSDELHRNISNTNRDKETIIQKGALVREVCIVDGRMNAGQYINNVTDAYEVVAAAVYQMLMTGMGVRAATNGTNTDTILNQRDRMKRRTVYSAIGVQSIVYPGDTLRRCLDYRFRDWLIRQRLLASWETMPNDVQAHPGTGALRRDLDGLLAELDRADGGQVVGNFEMEVSEAAHILSDTNSDAAIDGYLANIRAGRSEAVSALQQWQTAARRHAEGRVRELVADRTLRTGYGLAFAADVLKIVKAERTQLQLKADKAKSDAFSRFKAADMELSAAYDEVRAQRGLLAAMLGKRKRSAERLAATVAEYGSSALSLVRAESRAELGSAILVILEEMRVALSDTIAQLHAKAARLQVQWEADVLIGKDAGTDSLTALIPADTMPEVDQSPLIKEAWKRVMEAMPGSHENAGFEFINDFISLWCRGEAEAPFQLGRPGTVRGDRAAEALDAALESYAGHHALQGSLTERDTDDDQSHLLYLPRSLKAAAERVGSGALDLALTSMQGLSKTVLLSVDAQRVSDDGNLPTSTVVACPKELLDRVIETVGEGTGISYAEWPDRERIQAYTKQYGISAHAISALAVWHKAYQANVNSDSKPPHLDRRWSTTLRPLIPSTVDDSAAAELLHKALVYSKMFEEVHLSDDVFTQVRGRVLPSILSRVDRGGARHWQGQVFVIDGSTGKWTPQGSSLEFGTGWVDLLEGVWKSLEFRRFIREFDNMMRQSTAVTLASLRAANEQALEQVESAVAKTNDLEAKKVLEALADLFNQSLQYLDEQE